MKANDKNKRKSRPKLTPREAKAIEFIADGKKQTEAMAEAGFPKSMVASPANGFSDKPAVRNSLQMMQDTLKQVIPEKRLAVKLSDLMEATKIDARTGEVVADNQAQNKAVETVARIQQYIQPSKVEINQAIKLESILD